MLAEPDISTGHPEGPDLPDVSPDELQVACALIGLGATTSPLAIAADLGIEPHQFLATLQRPHVRRWIDAALAAEDIRIELIEKRAKVEALDTLSSLTRDTSIDPIERRRAATAVLRALARPVPPRSRGAASDEWGGIASRRQRRPDAGAVERSETAPTVPGADSEHDPEQAARAAKLARWNQLDRWEEDARAIRRRFDFKTPEAAAASIARIITTADRGDPEAALHALFLVTSVRRNYEDPERFAHHTRYLMHAAGGNVTRIEHVERANSWECVRVTLQPNDADPLDLAMWFHPRTPDFQPESEKFWNLFAIVPWEDDNWRRPWREADTWFHLVDPLHPQAPHETRAPHDPPRTTPPQNGHTPPAPHNIPGPAPP